MTYLYDEDFMQYAIRLARIAGKKGEIPVGAVLVQNKNQCIIGKGWNQSITLRDPTAHAEIVAIRQGGKIIQNYRLLDTTLYVTLEPCMMCTGAIIHSRIQRLVYGASDTKSVNTKTVLDIMKQHKINPRIEIKKNILAPECASILRSFFFPVENNKKIPYNLLNVINIIHKSNFNIGYI
ncbi:tRNA adenosine(34) deaminase TadA [Candidatus Ishikawella capsulata]|uniref:tRNA-specific adenosine deaminase n=1 Tax=Candidatus Ishikawaella capsulata Mpkobe TaxID=476281 RepID=C5WD30_9ENTR|nr:tRNA adenosine(34) deaminase TadA [Candidatus Ishikawaella capsulata]BAH83236.1 tRNA-specific adenosine deaminase [Candidatus Ishikawaella capsulata Mpkobe]